MASAAGSHPVDRRKSARDPLSITRDRQIDQYLMMPLLNFPLLLNFQFLLMSNVELQVATLRLMLFFVFVKCPKLSRNFKF